MVHEEAIFTVNQVATGSTIPEKTNRLQSIPPPSILLLEKAVTFNDKEKREDETARDIDEERKR